MIVIGGILLVMFGLVLAFKRRAGLLLLGLLAGGTLSELWAAEVTRYVGPAGLDLGGVPLGALIALIITVAPALLLLPVGLKHGALLQRALSAAVVGTFTVMLLLPVIDKTVVIEQAIRPVYDPLLANREVLLSAGILYGVFDVFTGRAPKVEDKKK